MAITVTVAATARAYTTLAAVRRELEIETAFTDDDTYIGELIKEAASTIEKIIGYKMPLETIAETIQGRGHPVIMVSRLPLVSISKIEYLDALGGTYTLASTTYQIADYEAGLIECAGNFANTSVYEPGAQDRPITGSFLSQYKVTYNAGYVMADAVSPAVCNLPESIQRVAKDAVVTWYVQRGLGKNVSSRRIADQSFTYSDEAFYKQIENRLKHWTLTR